MHAPVVPPYAIPLYPVPALGTGDLLLRISSSISPVAALQTQSYHTDVLKILCKISEKYQSKHIENIKVDGRSCAFMMLTEMFTIM